VVQVADIDAVRVDGIGELDVGGGAEASVESRSQGEGAAPLPSMTRELIGVTITMS
jgi:hypothetical protein